MIGFVIGLLVGSVGGVFLMALAQAASDADGDKK